MDVASVIALITKGVSIIEALSSAGQAIAPAIAALKTIFNRDRSKPITQEDLDKVEAVLDALIDEFDLDLPPA